MAEATYNYIIASNDVPVRCLPSNKLCTLSEDVCSPQSTSSYLSSTSTTHSSSLSPCLEKQ